MGNGQWPMAIHIHNHIHIDGAVREAGRRVTKNKVPLTRQDQGALEKSLCFNNLSVSLSC